jgi:hypothetical protein
LNPAYAPRLASGSLRVAARDLAGDVRAGDRGRVVRPVLGGADRTGAAQRGAALGEQDVLDRDRDAVQEAGRLAAPPAFGGGPRGLQRPFGVDQAERVELGIDAFDAFQDGLGDLDR